LSGFGISGEGRQHGARTTLCAPRRQRSVLSPEVAANAASILARGGFASCIECVRSSRVFVDPMWKRLIVGASCAQRGAHMLTSCTTSRPRENSPRREY
jgi:hypothetical protein